VADEIVVVVPSKHEWVGQHVNVQQLRKAPLILRERGSGTRRVVEAALKAAGIQMKHTSVIMELDSTEAIKSAVEAGLGRVCLPPGYPERNQTRHASRGSYHQFGHSTNFVDYLPSRSRALRGRGGISPLSPRKARPGTQQKRPMRLLISHRNSQFRHGVHPLTLRLNP
jgi:DNA-binding transcriptional LysR family regulator